MTACPRQELGIKKIVVQWKILWQLLRGIDMNLSMKVFREAHEWKKTPDAFTKYVDQTF